MLISWASMSSWAVHTCRLIYPTRSRPLENLCLLMYAWCDYKLQKKLSCVYFPSLEFMESQEMPVRYLISCLNAWFTCTPHNTIRSYMHLLNHYLQEIIRSLRAVILLPFPDMIKTSLSLERTYLQALNSLLSSRSPLSLAPLSSSTSQVALMTLKQFKLSDCKH